MNDKLRRILLISAFAITTIAVGLLLYYVFFRTTPSDRPDTDGIPDGLPIAETGAPTVITPSDPNFLPTEPIDSPTDSPSLNDQDPEGLTATRTLVASDAEFSNLFGLGVQYYQPTDGRFYRLTPDGNISPLSDKQFPSIQNVTWSPSNSEAVLEFPDGANVVFNFNTNKQVTLPRHWEDFDFSDDGNSLAFKSDAIDPDNRWLGIANPDGTSAQAIEPLGNNGNEVIVDWSPTRQIVAMRHVSTAKDEQTIYMVGLNGENFKSITAPGLGFQSAWSPTGQQLTFSVSSAATGYRPQLWIADSAGENIGNNRRSLPINTWIEKCSFASNTQLICAVPKEMPVGAGLAPGIQAELEDEIYSIDTTTGQSTRIAVPNTSLSAKKILVTPDKQTAYIEAYNGAIYSIQL